MPSIQDLDKRLKDVEERNKKVASDKAWEISYARRGLLVLFIYLAVGLYLQAISIENPWLNAIVPSLGFLLSTLTLPFFKKIGLRQFTRNDSVLAYLLAIFQQKCAIYILFFR